MYLSILLISTFSLLKYANCDRSCLTLNISMTCTTEENGFHNKLSWSLKLLYPTTTELVKSRIRLALHLNVPPGMFVNPDEVADLERLGKLSVYIDGNIDIEKAKEESSQYNVYVYLPEIRDGELVATLPVHLRYHLAQIDGGFEKVVLTKPSLLAYSSKSTTNICAGSRTVEAPCELGSTDTCNWKNVSYQALFDDVEMLVPIGDLNHFLVVAFCTLLIGCIGCLYLLSMSFAAKYE